MITRTLRIDPNALDTPAAREALDRAAVVIGQGGLVAFPTETVYGLGANAFDPAAVARIFEAKRRALNDPLIVHVRAPELAAPDVGPKAALAGLWSSGVIGDLAPRQVLQASTLIGRFWPGPLTLVLPRGARIPASVTSGGDTVGVRMPHHPIALALLERAGVPIAAPSANLFGHVSPTSAQHVLDDLDGRIDLLFDGGPTMIGVESTVLDLTGAGPRILRPGGAPRQEIEACIGPLLPAEAPGVALRSPGLLEKHYAPRAALKVLPDLESIRTALEIAGGAGRRVGLLLNTSDRAAFPDALPAFVLGDTPEAMARDLYAGLRALDDAGADIILCRAVSGPGLAEAIADRLRRAAR